MWTICSWLIKHTYEASAFTFLIPAPRSLDMSALTLSFHSSCVNTTKVGVKKHLYKKERAHLVQSLSSLQCTLMTDSRPLFSSVTTSHSSTQENGCGVRMKRGPVMVAKAVNAFLTMWILCRALGFSDYKSLHTWGEISFRMVPCEMSEPSRKETSVWKDFAHLRCTGPCIYKRYNLSTVIE